MTRLITPGEIIASTAVIDERIKHRSLTGITYAARTTAFRGTLTCIVRTSLTFFPGVSGVGWEGGGVLGGESKCVLWLNACSCVFEGRGLGVSRENVCPPPSSKRIAGHRLRGRVRPKNWTLAITWSQPAGTWLWTPAVYFWHVVWEMFCPIFGMVFERSPQPLFSLMFERSFRSISTIYYAIKCIVCWYSPKYHIGTAKLSTSQITQILNIWDFYVCAKVCCASGSGGGGGGGSCGEGNWGPVRYMEYYIVISAWY